jgi:hypothetical protein
VEKKEGRKGERERDVEREGEKKEGSVDTRLFRVSTSITSARITGNQLAWVIGSWCTSVGTTCNGRSKTFITNNGSSDFPRKSIGIRKNAKVTSGEKKPPCEDKAG